MKLKSTANLGNFIIKTPVPMTPFDRSY